jgi:4-amino-4-deoxy-L-arabinose transferase-like glycosyltransferase
MRDNSMNAKRLINRMRQAPCLWPLVLGSGLRIGAMAILAGRGVNLAKTSDDYLAIGHAWIVEGRFPQNSTVFPPLYPLLCALCERVFGSYAIWGVLITQCAISVITIYLTYKIAQVIVEVRWARVAAFLVACSPALIVAQCMIMTETVYTFLLAVSLFYAVTVRENPYQWAAMGVALGCLNLVRAAGIVVWPALLLFWLFKRQRFYLVALAACVAFAIDLPAMLINFTRYGHFEVSCSAKYNIAAMWAGPAKARADGLRDFGSNVAMWDEPDYGSGDRFAVAQRAYDRAMQWWPSHKWEIAKSLARGQANLLFGPGNAYAERVFGHVPGWVPVLLVYRIVVVLLMVLGVIAISRQGFPVALLFATLLYMHVLAPGANGYSRFAVPIVPMEAILCSSALRWIKEKQDLRRMRYIEAASNL